MPLSASKVSDAEVKQRVAEAFQAKYAKQIDELWGEPVTVDDFDVLYRLSPRD